MAEWSVARCSSLVLALKRKDKGLSLKTLSLCARLVEGYFAALRLEVVIECVWVGMLMSLTVPLTSSPSGLLVVLVLALCGLLPHFLLRLRSG